MVPATHLPLRFDPDFLDLFLLDEVECDLPLDGHVLCGVAYSCSGVIFIERHIENPVQGVLNGPVGTGGASKIANMLQGGQVVASVSAGFFITNGPFSFDHAQASESGPVVCIRKPSNVFSMTCSRCQDSGVPGVPSRMQYDL